MNDVFISYRRQDSQAYAGRIYDLLAQHLGGDRVFMDVDGISPGEDFVQAIGERLSGCTVFLAVIGPRWPHIRKGLRRRLFHANDFVRLEILVALSRPVKTIPVLVGGASLPPPNRLPKSIAGITSRNYIEVSDRRFREDVAKLAETIRNSLPAASERNDAALEQERQRVEQLIRADLDERLKRGRKRMKLAAWPVAGILAAGAAVWSVQHLHLFSGAAGSSEERAGSIATGSLADSPQFGRPDPDPTRFRVAHESDMGAYQKIANDAKEQAPRAIPKSRGGVEPVLKLADVWGPTGHARMRATEKAGKIVFHAAGSTGNVHSPKDPSRVASKMTADFEGDAGKVLPSFFLNLGDVIYSFGEAKYYYDQFYLPYRQYPAPILAVAGNHDGMVAPGAATATLEAFLANFCAPNFRYGREEDTLGRTLQIQPGVYYTLDAPFVRIIVLYSNTLEGPGVISGQKGQYSSIARVQLEFLEAALNRVKSDQFQGAVIVAAHHDFYAPSKHGGSPKVVAELDEISKKTGVWPHALLSGHSHSYQRYSRKIDAMEIPYIVAGNGGYGLAHLGNRDEPLRVPMPLTDSAVSLQSYDDRNFGFLRLTADAKQLRIEYRQAIDGPAPADAVTVDLKTHKLVYSH